MDEDFDPDFDDEDGLDIGTAIIVTTDEGIEVGTLLGSSLIGVRLKVTHRVERQPRRVSEEDRAVLAEAVEEMTRKELIQYAFQSGDKLSFLKKRKALVEECTYFAVEDEREHMPIVDLVKPNSRPISTFIPMDRVQKIQSLSELDEEQTLRKLEFSVEQ